MGKQDYLTDQLLIAMPTLADPNFTQTVTYICEHNERGAMGIVLNRPMEISLGDMLQQLDLEPSDPSIGNQQIFSGGPVLPERGFVLHRPVGNWDSTLAVTDAIAVTTSRDILEAIANGRGPKDAFIALGYAGWGAGQLEAEITENAWLSCQADARIIFEYPFAQRWIEAAKLMGVDPHLISGDAGHA